ncbi:MAG: TPM domain-containing protein [Clostridia bacterium]|nr:TPM domain-containing protein [Clostridia bacterium]
MTKKIFAILFAVLIGFMFVVSASADTYVHIADNANKLSGSEFEELENIAIKLENAYGVCVMVCIADETTGMYDDAYAEWIYADYTDNENGVILLHNDSENTYGVFASGSAEEIFDDEAIAEMRDAYDSNDSYYGGVYDYYVLAEEYLEAAYYGDDGADNPAITTGEADEKDGVAFIWLPVSLGIGLLVGFLIINSIASKNKSVQMQKNATVYTRPGSMVITGSADNFLYSNVEKKEKPKQQNKN